MPFPVECRCGQRFMAQDHLSGTRVPCPACGDSLLIQNPKAARSVTPSRHGNQVACVCGRTYHPGPELSGRTVRCTACGNVIEIPALPGSSLPVEQQLALVLPQRTVFPTTMKRPARPARSKSTRTPEAREQLTFRIVIGLAITVCLCAIIGGVAYIVLPMTRQVAENGENENETAHSSEGDVSETFGDEDLTRDDTGSHLAPRPSNQFEDAGTNNLASSADSSDQGEPAGSSDPFKSETAAIDPDAAGTAAAMDAREFASRRGASGPEPSRAFESTEVTKSEVAAARSLDLPGSLNAWHDQSNRDLTGLRKISGDNLAVYAHYSWMTELLPHLGHQDIYDKFDFSKSWLNEDNLQLSGELIPQFQNPNDTRQRWNGYPFENMALSHFVGMSGVEDRRNVVAAKLPRSDPRAGVFGYDDVAKRDEITDGQSNTIMLMGSGKLASPWVAGGGATVRGAREPYFDKLTGFGSKSGSKQGAITVMADGSVRFISSDVDTGTFRAMSTIHGGESVDLSPWTSAATLTK